MTDKNPRHTRVTELNASHRLARVFSTAMLLLALFLMAGCATTASKSPEDVVRERVEARWEALLSGDLERAYSLYSPGFRSTTTLIDFMLSIRVRKVKWTSAEYVEQTCDVSVCKVKVDIGYQVMSPVPGLDVWNGKSAAEETWIFNEGEWWFLPTN